MAILPATLVICVFLGFIALLIVVPISIHLAMKRRREYYQYLQDTHDIAEKARGKVPSDASSDYWRG